MASDECGATGSALVLPDTSCLNFLPNGRGPRTGPLTLVTFNLTACNEPLLDQSTCSRGSDDDDKLGHRRTSPRPCCWKRKQADKAVAEYWGLLPGLFRLRAHGATLRDIAANVNDRGVRTREGADWSQVQVKRLFDRVGNHVGFVIRAHFIRASSDWSDVPTPGDAAGTIAGGVGSASNQRAIVSFGKALFSSFTPASVT
jgi:hypothetical protein